MKKFQFEIVGEINRPPMERTSAVVNLFEKAQKSCRVLRL